MIHHENQLPGFIHKMAQLRYRCGLQKTHYYWQAHLSIR